MTKRNLIEEVARLYPQYARRDAEVIVNTIFDSMAETLQEDGRIEIRGFGSFVVKHRRAREGRNPKTGRPVAVEAKRVPFFKVGKELKLRVDGVAEEPEQTAGQPQALPGDTLDPPIAPPPRDID